MVAGVKLEPMFQEQPKENDTELWRKVFEKEIAYIQARQEYL